MELLIAFAIILCAYFMPALAAYGRGHREVTAITVLNILLGWTFLGWVHHAPGGGGPGDTTERRASGRLWGAAGHPGGDRGGNVFHSPCFLGTP
jgi:hypothetical protein